MVPLMVGQLRLTQHRAHGTSLAMIMFVAAAGAIGYWRAGNIDWQLALALTPGAVAGVTVGTRAMVRVPALQLRLLFGVFLLFVAFRELIWDVSAGGSVASAGPLAEVVFGFAGGLLAGVLGVGGGAIFVPAIVIFGLADASPENGQQVAQGVSLVVIVATAGAGTVTNLRQDTVDMGVVRWGVPAAVVAAFAAAVVANRLDAGVLERIYGLAALGLGIESIVTSLRGMRGRPLIRRV
jgi:uncharacterized membrane protein YfcA